jgi:hypothetical protein
MMCCNGLSTDSDDAEVKVLVMRGAKLPVLSYRRLTGLLAEQYARRKT